MEHGGTRGDAFFDNVRAEQLNLATGSGHANELAKCVYVDRPATWALEGDGIHYTGTTNRQRGSDAGTAMAALL